MEFSQPTGFYPNGFPNIGQSYPFNTPPPFPFNGYSEIVGEGNVTSMVSPDGSTQFLFMPTAQWWRPYLRYPNSGNCNNPYLNNLGAWLIRSIYNPIPPTPYSQPYPIPYGHVNPIASTSDCCLNLPTQGFTLKFHNDISTSTSDIHYFYPKQYYCFQKLTEGVTNQVQAPCSEVMCTNPCNCAPVHSCKCASRGKRKQKSLRIKKTTSSSSAMSIDESKSDLTCHKKRRRKKAHALKRTRSKSCSTRCEQPPSDKCVTTFAEQASGCAPENGAETQTSCQSMCISMPEINSQDFVCTPELWEPNTPMSKKAMTIDLSGTSEELFQKCCCANCSSYSDTE